MRMFGIVMAVFFGALLLFGAYGCSARNSFVAKREAVDGQWGQVENAYQRRLDLVPNMVETVKGYASHEKGVFEAVTKARAEATSVKIDASNLTPEQLAKFEQAQATLAGALSKLLVVAESYPQLKADTVFVNLQQTLEGSENRIAVERNRFNERAREFNTAIQQYPGAFFAGGFSPRPYFKATEGADKAPAVNFGGGR